MNAQTDRLTEKQMGKKLYTSYLSMPGHNNDNVNDGDNDDDDDDDNDTFASSVCCIKFFSSCSEFSV